MSDLRRAHAGIRAIGRKLGVRDLPARTVRVQRNRPQVMRDGTTLLADRWVPEDEGDDAPLVLIRTPYGRAGLTGLTYVRMLAHSGFQVLVQSCRGTDGSGGTFDRPFAAEADDGHDTVRWLRDQPWYRGTFATAGGSYFGYTQLALAAAAPDEHSAAVLQATPTSVRDIVWPDGVFAPGMALRWAAQTAKGPNAAIRNAVGARALDKRIRQASLAGPLASSYQQATGKPLDFFEQWLDAENPHDPRWKELDHSDALDVLRCPTLVQAGWYDVFVDASFQQYQRLRARGVDARLTAGPWTHAQVGLKGMPDVLEFLTEVLKGGTPRADGHRVRLLDIGGQHEQLLSEWPTQPDAHTYTITAAGLTDGSIAAGPTEVCFTYDPTAPTPQVGGALLDMTGGGAQDNSTLEERDDVLTFDTETLASARVVRGCVTASLALTSDRPATTLFLRLCDRAPDGSSINLADRMLSLPAQDQPSWNIDVTFPPVSAAVDAGHRLVLQISSGAFPRWQPHSGTTEMQGAARRRQPARQTLHLHRPDQPATLTVPFATP